MTWVQFIQYAAYPALVAVAALAWRAHQKAESVLAELNAYKLQAAEKYASISYLKDVEQRLVVSLDKIEKTLSEVLREMRRPAGGE